MATIIGAVDHNDDTLALGRTLKRLTQSGDQVVILGIAPSLSNEITDHKVVSSAKRAEQALLNALTEKTGNLSEVIGQTCDVDLVSGAPAEKIIETSILRKADLVVKEDDELSSNERARMGKVARRLLKRAPSATLILRNPIDAPTPHIVIAVDNAEDKLDGPQRSLLNARVLETGVDMAKRLDANEVTLLHVWRMADLQFLKHPRSGLSEESVDHHIDQNRAVTSKWFESFREEAETKYASSGLSFSTKLIMGEGGKAIAEAASELHSDLLVIGSANRRGIQSLFFGNTAENVLSEALCNLLVVKPADFYQMVTG